MPRVNRRLVHTVYWAGICRHVAYWHAAYFDRTVDVHRALIGRPTNMRNLKKSYELGGNLLTCGMLTRGRFWSDGPRLPSRNLPRRQDKLWKSTFAACRFVIFAFPRFHVGIQVFCFSKVFEVLFSSFAFQAAGLLGLRFRAPNDITGLYHFWCL